MLFVDVPEIWTSPVQFEVKLFGAKVFSISSEAIEKYKDDSLISFQSTTKYLNGHSDSLGGALSTKRKDEFWDLIIKARNYQGSVMSPLNSWLLIRGLKTLFIRFQKSSNNAYY